ncbi:MAG TPA: D-alanyl-D-alanine dipeptidase [Phycisphaerae bacterium]|nr:D-alanyl-D-alanine dipeptidase [Phycisphaerae bacterium]
MIGILYARHPLASLGHMAIVAALVIQAGCHRVSTPKTPTPDTFENQKKATPNLDWAEGRQLYTFTENELGQYIGGIKSTHPNLTERVIHLGRKNIGQPYDIYLLGEYPFETYDPDPLYCLSRSDCLTFCEHIYSMALSDDFPSFLQTLQRLRYKGGRIGMLTRNHYTAADWNRNNADLFVDLTTQLGEGKVQVPFTQVCRRARYFKKFGIGQDIPDEPITDSYIPKERVPEILDELQAGDFVNIVRGSEASQWVGHTGLVAIADDGTVDFLHSAGKAVREQELVGYLNGDKKCVGARFMRLRDNAETLIKKLLDDDSVTDVSPDALQRAWNQQQAKRIDAIKQPPLTWMEAQRLQGYRLDYDSKTDASLQTALERIDQDVRKTLEIKADDRSFGVLSLNDQKLAMIEPDRMFYGASVPKIAILLAYFETHPDAATNLPDDVRDELGRMIKNSDNVLAAKYGAMIGIEKVQEIAQSKRYQFFDKDHGGGLWYGKHYGKDSPRIGDPIHDHSHGATVRQCLRYYLLMEQLKLVNAEASITMLEIFASEQLEHGQSKFVKGLSSKADSILRKSGTWRDWHLDTARVRHGDHFYLIAGMVNHPRGAEYLSEMASRIDELICNNASPSNVVAQVDGQQPLVKVADVVPGIVLDLRYATTDNFTGEQLYPQATCLLRKNAADRLARVQAGLRERGLGLKIYDGYRPLSVQKKMWKLVPDPRYVADPKDGSRHNRGCAVDVTLVDADGHELEMPTGYDDFTEAAHQDYEGGSPASRRNRNLLRAAMESEGFVALDTEWWHFDAPDWQAHPVMDVPLASVGN